MVIDCDRCVVRDVGCADCVVTVLLGLPAGPVQLDAEERAAIGVLAGGGLVPPLRLLTTDGPPAAPPDRAGPEPRRAVAG